LPTIEPAAGRSPRRLEIRPHRRRRSRRRVRRLVRRALLVGFGLLLLLLMIEPERRSERRAALPAPAPVELAALVPERPTAAQPAGSPAVAGVGSLRPVEPRAPAEPRDIVEPTPGGSPSVPTGEATRELGPVSAGEPVRGTGEERVRLSGGPPSPRDRAVGEPAPMVHRPLPVPSLELVRPVPVAFPGPVVRRPAGRPTLAVIVDDLGLNAPATRRAIRLPGPLTLAFLPYGESTPELAREARAAGHQVFLHLAMEPLGGEDPGPMALLSSLGPEELRRRLLWALGRVPGAAGVNNHMGSRLTADPRAMAVVMGELGRLGLPFVDSMTTASSVAARVALEGGVVATARDVFLDNDPAPTAILAQLERAERLARRTGSAVAIGHPYPSTLQVLAGWLPGAVERGLRLVPATAVIELRGCAGEAAGRGGCLLRATSEPDAGERLPACGADCPATSAAPRAGATDAGPAGRDGSVDQ